MILARKNYYSTNYSTKVPHIQSGQRWCKNIKDMQKSQFHHSPKAQRWLSLVRTTVCLDPQLTSAAEDSLDPIRDPGIETNIGSVWTTTMS